ncbi:hypothetical protein [Paenibacillus sp. NAIST15-1]|uniref:hypothetical protein n=1 Tax=Paenibacillus sp. NAIST15-1 TaxID=1605994 RepID=UPI00086CBB43|nr:hypothetical protein [Paenibacillus sp. NAIST15-1]GAV11321.1 YlbO protein [Paenibacillus sp. NAIST15-1]
MERKDKWSNQENILLAQTVISHISKGSTQLNAFDEVAEALNRTPAACGFRWNSEVRNDYKNEIRQAKTERAKLKGNKSVKVESSTTPFDSIIAYLSRFEQLLNEKDKQIQHLKDEVRSLRQNTNSDDLNSLMEILRRAKDLGAMDKIS